FIIFIAFVHTAQLIQTAVAIDVLEVPWNGRMIDVHYPSENHQGPFRRSDDCETGFLKPTVGRNDTCYMFVLTNLTWSEANVFCTTANGDGLLTIEDADDQLVITGYISTTKGLRAERGRISTYYTSGHRLLDGQTW
ncbi:unnamed protein product, partial [Owenia fusiformis]